MMKMWVGALLGAPLVAAPTVIGAASGAGLAAAGDRRILDYGLAAEALVMIPAMNQDWLDLSKDLYLVPNGFDPDGTATFLQVPETNDLNASISGATQILIDAVAQRWSDGAFSSEDPLYIFGYSQSNVAAGLAAEQLHQQYPDMPLDALHFVMVGDSAADGGFLSGFMATLLQGIPESWHDDVINMVYQFAAMMHIDSVIGLVTPSDLYTTDVYSLSSDGFANWDNGQQMVGMFSDHLAYLGLTPAEIASATDEVIGNATYHMIDSANVNMFQALLNSLDMIIGGVLAWF
ncbi:PE-PPE domain-containing protein [Mycolicibacter heraklionensis]|uniref:PE-PPE domain-containing protein n=1 Tax=Mycolicibacter heraklionensis TaxID=512402 RepID=A0AA91IYP4_9MYCO|nr:PE-PPE domain-containing protein [Mycolicibacter heraklionensis]OBK86794.1 PE-PPE domain-containing protein [Mycolicibacter heraklionensis]